MRKYIFFLLGLLLVACGPPTVEMPEPTATPQEVVVEPTAQPTEAPTATPLPEPTAEPTPEPSPTAEPTEEPAVEEEWVTYAVPANGFFLSLPASWREIPLDEETLAGAIETIGVENPEITRYLESGVIQNFLLSGASFLGFDLSLDSILMSSPANINIIKEERLAAVSLAFHVETTKGILENFPNVSSLVITDIVELSYGEVGKLNFEITIILPDGTPLTRDTIQYVFVDGVDIYTLTFSHDAEFSKMFEPIYLEIADSFQLGEAPDGAILTGPAEETVVNAELAVTLITNPIDAQLKLLDLADSAALIYDWKLFRFR